MSRIRTLKPEHKGHRKVGMLTHRQYRLWVGMITEADDEGRLCADARQLRAQVFPYHPEVSVEDIADELAAIAEAGSLHLYRVGDLVYAHFIGWRKHQYIDRPRRSQHPTPTCCSPAARRRKYARLDSANARRTLAERSPLIRRGSEGIGRDRKGKERIGKEGSVRETKPVDNSTEQRGGLLTQSGSGSNDNGEDHQITAADDDAALRLLASAMKIPLAEARRRRAAAQAAVR